MKTKFTIIFSIFILTACVPRVASTPTPPTLTSTLMSAPDSVTAAPTQPSTDVPTPTPATTSTPTKTLVPTPIPATATPSQPPIAVVTWEPEQLKRWQDYENALGNKLLGRDASRGKFLCEWEVLGQSGLELYLWSVCSSTVPISESGFFPASHIPAVILHTPEGDIEEVKIPGAGTYYARDIRAMFPVDVQERIFGRLIDFDSLSEHLDFRREHLEDPPLIVLDATPTQPATTVPTPIPATATPSQPPIAVVTWEPEQLKRWQDYEHALGNKLLGSDESIGKFLCEWEVLGQSGLELYLWVVCSSTVPFGKFDGKDRFPYYETPALILHTEEGNIEAVKIPGGGTHYARDIRALFPADVQERIFNRLIDTRSLSEHLDFRREHLEDPPLIVLDATPVP